MGMTPIGPLAMLPLSRSTWIKSGVVPMPRVEQGNRARNETYSPGGQGDGHRPRKEAQESESGSPEDGFFVLANEEPLEYETSLKDETSFNEGTSLGDEASLKDETSFNEGTSLGDEASLKDEANSKVRTNEVEDSLPEATTDAASSFESPDESSSKLSFFA